MSLLIGISGKMGTGKTDLAVNLSSRFDEMGRSSMIVNFGDFLKTEISNLFGIPLSHCYKEKERIVTHKDLPKPMAIREVLQWYGTDIVREKSVNYWIDQLEKFKNNFKRMNIFIVGDVRFPNEKEWIEKNGGITIRLEPYDGWKQSYFHESETALDDVTDWNYWVKPWYRSLGTLAKILVKEIYMDDISAKTWRHYNKEK